MKIYFHLRFVFEIIFVTANFTMDLNTATFEEMQSLAGIGHGTAHAIFDGRANLSRPLTLLDLLEMGIPADVVKALVDDLEIKATPRHGEKVEGIDVQQMVIAALASLQKISSNVNGLSVAIDNVNMRQAHFESVLKAGGRIAGPRVECGELNTKPMAMASNKMSDAGSQTDILGDSEGCLSGSKLEHTDIAASDLFNSPIIQNEGLIDLVESPRRVEVPSQPEANTVVSCSCSNTVRSRCTPAQGEFSPPRNVVGDMRRQEGSTSSSAYRYRWAKIRKTEFRGSDKWSSYLVQFRTIMKMHGCYDNDVMVFKLVEALRGHALEYYNSLPDETRGQLSTLCTLFEGRFGRQEPPATMRSNMKTIIQRVDEPHRIFYDSLSCRPRPVESIRLKGASASRVMVGCRVDGVEVDLGDGHGNYSMTMYVANITDSCILGSNYLKARKAVIDLSQGVLVVNDTIVKGKYKYAEGTPVRTHKVRLVDDCHLFFQIQ